MATTDTTATPLPVVITWTERDGQRLTGLMTLGPLGPADHAALEATGRTDQFLITGGVRRTTMDAFNDYTPTDTFHAYRAAPERCARLAADWLGFTGRPLHITTVHEYRHGA